MGGPGESKPPLRSDDAQAFPRRPAAPLRAARTHPRSSTTACRWSNIHFRTGPQPRFLGPESLLTSVPKDDGHDAQAVSKHLLSPARAAHQIEITDRLACALERRADARVVESHRIRPVEDCQARAAFPPRRAAPPL